MYVSLIVARQRSFLCSSGRIKESRRLVLSADLPYFEEMKRSFTYYFVLFSSSTPSFLLHFLMFSPNSGILSVKSALCWVTGSLWFVHSNGLSPSFPISVTFSTAPFTLKMEAADSSETFVSNYQTTRRLKSNNRHLTTRNC
jgi:hypothetical protein